MKLQRFFVNNSLRQGENDIVDENISNQLRKVFRAKVGYEVMLLDNSGKEFLSIIKSFTKDGVVFDCGEGREVKNMPNRRINIFLSIIKKDHFELALEKCVELGVYSINPVIAERSEKKDLNFERLNKIAKEASEQSERGMLPVINPISNLEDAIVKSEGSKIAFHTTGQIFIKEEFEADEEVSIFIGPEGGWTEKEIEIFEKNNIEILSLGNQILRAETATIAVATLFLL